MWGIVGESRIHNVAFEWRKQYKDKGIIANTEKVLLGRPLERELSDTEKLERAETKIFRYQRN